MRRQGGRWLLCSERSATADTRKLLGVASSVVIPPDQLIAGEHLAETGPELTTVRHYQELDARPRLRGRIHLAAAVVSVAALVWLVMVATTPRAEVAAWIYGLSAIACYATSATYHVYARTPGARRRWRQADHAMIYVLIAGTATPMYLLAASGMWRWLMFSLMWAGAALGIVLKVLSMERFRTMGWVLYIGLGWTGLALLPYFWAQPRLLALVVAAGVTYTVGAVLFALGRPNPLPRWYGYHEVWHTLGVAAGAIFFVAILPLVQAG